VCRRFESCQARSFFPAKSDRGDSPFGPLALLHLRREETLLRRSRGEGSIYRTKDGSWVARYEATGRRRYLYGKTKKAVTDKLRRRLPRERRTLPPRQTPCPSTSTSGCLPTVEGTIKEQTWIRHEEVVRLYLGLSIGKIKLLKLRDLSP
jgi:hypothetical protein